MDALYCSRSRLPILQMFGTQPAQSFWDTSLHFTNDDTRAFPTVLADFNANLTAAQKEVLLWHHKLAHASTSWIQLLMRDRKWLQDRDNKDVSLHAGSFLPCRTKGPTCDIQNLKCVACLCAKAQRRSTTHDHARHDPDTLLRFRKHLDGDNRLMLKKGHVLPGDCVSADHYISPFPGRLYSSFGREKQGYTCGTLFVDHASGKVFNFPQLSTTAADTLRSKHILERFAYDKGVKIKHYHSDNGVFASTAFRTDCESMSQKLSFSGVGAHHQNGVVERNIKTVSQWARANMLHAALHWHEYANIKLWPQAIDYAVWVFNRLPSVDLGLSPNELWSQARATSHDLRRTHPFGCPVYVLDPWLQDGHKIPKWDTRARRGMFVGFSKDHSSLVPLVLNIMTGKISPQFHVIFDDKFQTVASLPTGTTLRDEWLNILAFSHDCFLDDQNASDDDHLLPQEFSDWLTTKPFTPISDPSASSFDTNTEQAPPIIVEHDDHFEIIAPPSTHQPTDDDTDTVISAPEGAPVGAAPTRSNPPRNVGTWKDGPAKLRSCPIDGEEYDFTFNISAPDLPVAFLARRNLIKHVTQPLPQRIGKQDLLDCFLLQATWDYDNTCHRYHIPAIEDSSKIDVISDPRVLELYLATSKSKYNDDNPSFDMAMRGPFQGEYYEAMRTELNTIATDFKCWDLVPRLPGMNVLPSTWAFKVKRYPDGSVKKFKARFCARGDRQLEGVDFFQTWAPVVQWSTIRIVLVLAVKLGFTSVQCDITAAFIHAHLPDTEEIYVEQPRGFRTKQNHVLRLRRSLYGLKQAPRHFFHYLTERLLKHGLQQSIHDPCLFMNSSMIVIVYVDDLLIFAKSNDLIDSFISSLQNDDICLRKEGSAEGYLGVDITHVDGKIHLTQPGLSERIIAALGLDKNSTPCATPAEATALPKDAGGDPASGTINYASVVGMLLYLCGHTRPDLAFAVHQCARYTFAPTKRHEHALLRIGRYLKGTINKGLILNPSHDLHLDCYPDADFAGLWKHEHPDDPHCVRSRTGYLITLANCPVIWASKMQTEIALSTMEAEYIALSTACRDLFPLMDKLSELTSVLNLPFKPGSNMHVRIHEDNVGALTLGQLEPRRMTPRSKHYAVKYHWFCEHISIQNIELVKIASANQLGDIFTKGLTPTAFANMQKQLLGW